ncbi:MAG TPA: hypothetical protein VNH11_32135 [Pirellulales bacterium]|nr:hypothetical protein [Pirellulales bacterium]
MKFTVVWRPGAEQELARLWNGAADRADVAAAADTIDAALAREPLSFGESRGGATRIALVAPLAALYDVDEPDRLVTVWDLWRRQ